MEDQERFTGRRAVKIPPGVKAVGIDVGSLFLKTVGLAPDRSVLFYDKEPHRGNSPELLDRLHSQLAERNVEVGISSYQEVHTAGTIFDPAVCLRASVRSLFPEARNILEVGAAHLILIRLDHEGQILSIQRNSLCAAGTGSFLDAQAARMGIDYGNGGNGLPADDAPSIATRCAVFAKSDLIYRQQEGFPKDVLWSGLCRGLVDSLLRSLTAGRTLVGLTVLCGGVALNETFVWWLRQRLEDCHGTIALKVMACPEFAVALGAAILSSGGTQILAAKEPTPDFQGERKRRPALRLRRSRNPEKPESRFKKDSEGNEITLYASPGLSRQEQEFEVYLGVDIGSTSTKLVLVDAAGRILLDIYRPTSADPISAVQKLFLAVTEVAEQNAFRFKIKGAATTGSGRKLISPIIKADVVINEISAHVAGAVRSDPTVETIFEIGGQDAKYMSIKNSQIIDANMNYVCAAGTGSFVEELASKLGYQVEEIGETVAGIEPPYTSSRCTVFMEQDILSLLNRGISRPEAAGAVLYSVIENYLEQVVGRRPVNKKRIFFQGATARNRGLAAAIENILDVEVIVSPYCHVMGAFGAALLVQEKMNGRPSRFRGFDLGRKVIAVESKTCALCANNCQISRAVIEGELDQPSWGMKCGRDEKDGKVTPLETFDLFKKAIQMSSSPNSAKGISLGPPLIDLPRVLSMYSLYPFWHAFFEALGVDVRLGPGVTRQQVERGNQFTGSEFCLPLKAAIGQVVHSLAAAQQIPLFVPYMLADCASPGLTHSRFCPYVEALPSLIKIALQDSGIDSAHLVSPVLDFRLPDEANAKNLAESLRPIIPIDIEEATKALGRAHEARRRYEEGLVARGREAIGRITKIGRPVIVVIGRPYNTLDSELNQSIPRHIAECGADVIPGNCLPWEPETLSGEFKNLFWSYGQRILSALIQIARTEALYAVYLSNFSCGPDSFLLSYAETVMGEKPFLVLEVDEHGSSGSYETRIEAFLEVVKLDWEKRRSHPSSLQLREEIHAPAELKKRILWFPTMHTVGNRMFVAAFRREGYDARSLPVEDERTFSLGKRWTRGEECFPMTLTLGAFLDQIETARAAGKSPEKEMALFLPTSTGPCRFGQYRTLDRIIFERLGLGDIPILSPGAHNAYYGLARSLRKKIWGGILGGDILFKMRCRTLPYEITKGDTEKTLERWAGEAEALIVSGRMRWASFLSRAMKDFQRIPVRKELRPLVGIVGEIYARCNPFANNRVVETVEKLGGEVWLSPVAEWILYTAWVERYLSRQHRERTWNSLAIAAKWRYLSQKEGALYRIVAPLLRDRMEPSMDDIIKAGSRVVPPEFQGESILTLGRAFLFGKNGADLVVNCSPFGCMHGNITSAIFNQMRDQIGVPVVNIFYDGSEDNSILNAFVHEALRKKESRPATSPFHDLL